MHIVYLISPTRYRDYSIQRDTLDRAWWRIDFNKLISGGYYEAHLMKPLWHFIHLEQMMPLFEYLGLREHYEELAKKEKSSMRMLIIQKTPGFESVVKAFNNAGIECDQWIINDDFPKDKKCDRYSIVVIVTGKQIGRAHV